MARSSVSYVCQQCGSAFPKWAGKCDDCGAWNTLVEERKDAPAGPGKRAHGRQITLEPLQSASTAKPLPRMALRDGDNELAVHAYSQWGFDGLDKEAIEILNIWAGFIYGPLLEDRIRPIQELRGGNYGRELAGKVHEELKRIGGIKPPREFVLMDRAAVGLGSVFMHLKAEVNWHQLFHGMIDDFTLEALQTRQKNAIRQVGLPETLLGV